jgi:Xaa-Pro aminopeptidase
MNVQPTPLPAPRPARPGRADPWRAGVAVLAAAVAFGALAAGQTRNGEIRDDLKARRARVMERLGPDAMLILWSAPPARFSNDVDYVYRQDANLY